MAQESASMRNGVRKAMRRYGVSMKAIVACVGICVMLGAAGVYWLYTKDAGVVHLERDQEAGEDESPTDDGGRAQDGDKPQEKQTSASSPTPTCVVVHVDGAVHNPGVYAIEDETPRVMDAVEQAGGLSDEADTSAVNLASPITDGEKVHIPCDGEEAQLQPQAAQTAVQTSQSQFTQDNNAGLININTANADELKSLSGVGDATAAAIIEDRESQGPFTSPEDLMRVSGIGEKKFSKIRDHICV
ncbi:MAG: helix-hairpin-helix domain-containing protein [Coriobacteriales bacterium]|nr:helix-hairpin-helix domain-containing protein [Coriobacteriales bacterium]